MWHPTPVDVFLTNRPKCFSGVINVDIETSDFHNYVGVVTRPFAPRQIRRKIAYRSLKIFQGDASRADCDNTPFHISIVFDDIDDIYWPHNQMFLSVLNEHEPLKTKWIKRNKFPIWIQNCVKRYTNVTCGEINISKTKEIDLRGKIMLNGGTKWSNLRKVPSKRILSENVTLNSDVKIFTKPWNHSCLTREVVVTDLISFCGKVMF